MPSPQVRIGGSCTGCCSPRRSSSPVCHPGPRRTPRWPASSGRRRTVRACRPWCRRWRRRRCRCSGRRCHIARRWSAIVATVRGGLAVGPALARAIGRVRVRRALVALLARVHLAVATAGRRGHVGRGRVDLLVGRQIDGQLHVGHVAAAGAAGGAASRAAGGAASRAAGGAASRAAGGAATRAAGGAASRAAGGANARAAGGAAARAAAETAAGREPPVPPLPPLPPRPPAASVRAGLVGLGCGSSQPAATDMARPATIRTCTLRRRRGSRETLCDRRLRSLRRLVHVQPPFNSARKHGAYSTRRSLPPESKAIASPSLSGQRVVPVIARPLSLRTTAPPPMLLGCPALRS
jgi:hypothetical protein